MEPWMWAVFGVAMWFIFAGKGSCSSTGEGRTTQRRERATSEIDRLKAELDASHAQVASLRKRLETLETIIADEDRELRRQFADLEGRRPA